MDRIGFDGAEQFGVTWIIQVNKSLSGEEEEHVRGRIAQLEDLIYELRQAGLRPLDRRYFFRLYKRCITGPFQSKGALYISAPD